MSSPSFSSLPSDPSCALCSKPVRTGAYIQTDTGEFVHIRCRSRELQLAAYDQGDRARRAIERATDLVQENTRLRLRPRRLNTRPDPCPVCGALATLTDWRPHIEWMAVEECSCRGFFVWTPLVDDGRLTRLTPEDRGTLSERIRTLSATGEVWLSTRDGTVAGALILRSERPDRPR